MFSILNIKKKWNETEKLHRLRFAKHRLQNEFNQTLFKHNDAGICYRFTYKNRFKQNNFSPNSLNNMNTPKRARPCERTRKYACIALFCLNQNQNKNQTELQNYK